MASNFTTAVATAIAMVVLSPRLSLPSLAVIPPAVWTTRRVALLRRDLTAARQRRLADLPAGRVTVDGTQVRDIAVENLAQIVGVVTQETYLVHPSIRDNLLLAAPDATDDELWCTRSRPHRCPGSSPPCRTGSTRSSVPEGIASAVAGSSAWPPDFAAQPRVLVLDEATSALDNETERELLARGGRSAGLVDTRAENALVA